MVKVREDKAIKVDGSIDVELWLENIQALLPEQPLNLELLRQASDYSLEVEEKARESKNVWSTRTSSFNTGLDMATILAEL